MHRLACALSLALAAGCAAPGRTEAQRIASADGVEIRYDVAGRGEPAIVFVHGWSCDRSYWRAQFDRFAATHRVVAIDLAGHGESGSNRERFTVDAFGNDVRAVVEALDLRRVVLVGHSLGGAVVVDAASKLGDRVAGLVPVDSYTALAPPEVREKVFPVFLRRMHTEFAVVTHELVTGHFFRPGTDPAFVKRIADDMAAGDPRAGASAMEHYIERADTLGPARAPVRLINSDLAPTELAVWRKQNPAVELAVMPATGHFLMMERPDEFNDLLRRAVERMSR